MTSELWTAARVAQYLAVSRKRIYQMVSAGQFQSLRLGERTIRIPRSSVEEFLKRSVERQKRELGHDISALPLDQKRRLLR